MASAPRPKQTNVLSFFPLAEYPDKLGVPETTVFGSKDSDFKFGSKGVEQPQERELNEATQRKVLKLLIVEAS